MIYWRGAEAALSALASDGFTVGRFNSRWGARGYKGVNITVRDPRGFDFEVQFHTSRSLAAAELSHGIYEDQRLLRRRSARWRELETQHQEVWKSVPIPPGRRELSLSHMEYYKFFAGTRWDYARVDPEEFSAEYFDPIARRWAPMDAYYDEVYHNGNGTPVDEAEALKAIGALQSA